MSFHVDRFTGNLTNVPVMQEVGAKKTQLLELNLAANAQRKNRDNQKYEPVLDKNGKQKVSWLTVKFWGEKAVEAEGEYVKGDLLEFAGSVQEEHFEKRDGTEGRRLESDFIESVTVKYPSKDRDNAAPAAAKAPQGFGSAPVPSGFGSADVPKGF